ncbi:MAG: MASE3 domain-containing protein, partial [Candidatus Doudnabacteria bacterium]
MDKVRVDRNTFVLAIAGLLTLVALYLISQYNYLLFHGIVELSSVIVIGCIFVITWNSRKYINNNYLIFIGIAYLFVGFIEFLHMMSYTGMNIFYQHGTNLPTQLWLAMKFM